MEARLDIAQQVFIIFYAVLYGAIFTISDRWRPFFASPNSSKSISRLKLSFVLLGVLPIIYFLFMFTQLSHFDKTGWWLIFIIFSVAPLYGIYNIWSWIVVSRKDKFFSDYEQNNSNSPVKHALGWVGGKTPSIKYMIFMSILLIVAPILALYFINLVNPSGELGAYFEEIPGNNFGNKNSSFLNSMIISIAFSSVAAVLISIIFQLSQANREARSLILAFATEFVFSFERCITYYEQSKKRIVSYSTLFNFSDASVLSKYATVCKNPNVIAAIVELKSIYYQVARHVDEASIFIAQAERVAATEKEKNRLKAAAVHAQRTAIVFFFGDKGEKYEDVERKTMLIIKAAKKVFPGDVIDGLSARFECARRKKSELETPEDENDPPWFFRAHL